MTVALLTHLLAFYLGAIAASRFIGRDLKGLRK